MEDNKLLSQVKEAWIETFTGQKFHFMDPKASDVRLIDIAHALANFCRYCGHTKKFYSVAEHCVLMARHAEKQEGYGPRDLLAILLHDASEAYIGDMTRPLKQQMPLFKEIEERIHKVVSEHYGLQYPHADWLKELDNRILLDERAQAMCKTDNEWFAGDMQPLGVLLQFWDPETAKKKFIQEFERFAAMASAA